MGVSLRSWLWQQSTDPMGRFLPLFFLYLGLIVTLSFRANGFNEFTTFLGERTAFFSHLLLSRFAEDVVLWGPKVSLKGFKVLVVAECGGLLEFMMYAAAVIAYPAKWRTRLIGLCLGIPVLFGFNVLRIMALLVVGRYEPTLFHFTHIYFWQTTMILMIGILWIAWIRFVVHFGDRAYDRAPLRS